MQKDDPQNEEILLALVGAAVREILSSSSELRTEWISRELERRLSNEKDEKIVELCRKALVKLKLSQH